MAANAFFFLNSLSYHGMTQSNLLATKDAHYRIINKKDASSRGLVFKDLPKVTTTRTTLLKPKMMLDQNENYPDLGFGRMLDDGFVFRQNFHIRSYEVGSDKRVTAETLANLLQETSINHLKAHGVWGDRLGLTPEMCKKNLIWVMAKLQLVVDRYPVWDDVIQIDTWKGAYGKIGGCTNWTFCDAKTGEMLLRASCIWLMMNEETRRLSKFPDEVRDELDKYFTETTFPTARKWSKRDETMVDYVRNGLMPRRSDLDSNQHVNYAKYIEWILESVPYSITENRELASMTLEYSRECTTESVLRSHTYVRVDMNDKLGDYDEVDCEHVLELENGDGKIMKGWTTWRSKHPN